MCPYFSKRIYTGLAFSFAAALLLSSCSTRVNRQNLGNVQIADGGTSGGTGSTSQASSSDSSTSAAGALPTANPYGERTDGNAEQQIAERAVHAWRVAIAHQKKTADMDEKAWKKQRADDEKAAMAELDQLEKDYPTQSTIQFMKGQVEEHFDKHDESIKWYKKATEKNITSSMTIFRLAEVERKAGKSKEAAADYRKLLAIEPHFGPAQLGLARILIAEDPKSKEGKELAKGAAAPDSPVHDEAVQFLKDQK